jgi:hypothetical protein
MRTPVVSISRARLWASRVLGGVVALLVLDAVIQLAVLPLVVGSVVSNAAIRFAVIPAVVESRRAE